MGKAIGIFVVTFFVVLLINQAFYGFCFSDYCLAAAFPRVVVLASIVTAALYWITKREGF